MMIIKILLLLLFGRIRKSFNHRECSVRLATPIINNAVSSFFSFLQLSLQDPVHTINLKDFVLQELTKCQSQYGQNTFNQLMETVDPDVVQQLQDFVHL